MEGKHQETQMHAGDLAGGDASGSFKVVDTGLLSPYVHYHLLFRLCLETFFPVCTMKNLHLHSLNGSFTFKV